jgi:hypothetical protein
MQTFPCPLTSIPDNWDSVTDFMNWYMENNMPFVPPNDHEIYVTDDAASVCFFRKGQFQVELYLIHPLPLVQMHEHPNVDVIKMRVLPFEDENNTKIPKPWATPAEVLKTGQAHGAGFRVEALDKGFPLFAIQHWKTEKPTTVAAAWKGKTVGPKHEALIKRLNPNAFVVEGYADTTKTMDYLMELRNAKNT